MGTRPEAIKLVPVIQEFRKHSGQFEIKTLVTAQHREMLDQVLTIFSVVPDHDLDMMRFNQDLSALTAGLVEGIARILDEEKPDAVVVQGDTTTAFAGALAAFYRKIPVGHVEAGLRSFDNHHPFPEEINRKLVAVLTRFHFAPTETSRKNLVNEGIPSERIYVTGNTIVDALNTIKQQKLDLSQIIPVDPGKKLILVTAHRRESFGKPLEEICQAIKWIVEANPDVTVVYPVHYNPNVQNTAFTVLKGVSRVHLIDPLSYPEFIHLMCHSYLLLTDSGGLQEEGPSLGKPVLVMRKTTERPEGVLGGVTKLIGRGKKAIVREVQSLLNNQALYSAMASQPNPFGDGKAAQRIVAIFKKGLL